MLTETNMTCRFLPAGEAWNLMQPMRTHPLNKLVALGSLLKTRTDPFSTLGFRIKDRGLISASFKKIIFTAVHTKDSLVTYPPSFLHGSKNCMIILKQGLNLGRR